MGKGHAQGNTRTRVLSEFFLRPEVLWRAGALGCFSAPLVRLLQEVSHFFPEGTHTRSASSALEPCYQDRVGSGWEVGETLDRKTSYEAVAESRRERPVPESDEALGHVVPSAGSFLLAGWARVNRLISLSFKLLISGDDNYLFPTAFLYG